MPSKFIMPIIVFCLLIILLTLVVVNPTTASPGPFQSWPSRTPTPGSEATRPSGGSTPGGGNPPPATSTPIVETPFSSPMPVTPSPTLFSTVEPGTIAATYVVEPTQTSAEDSSACDLPPQLSAEDRVEVWDSFEPGRELLGYLFDSELRVIIGRSAIAPWWLIQFEPDQQGWVMDSQVVVIGYIGYVPVISFESDAEAPNESWQPTPNPGCSLDGFPGILKTDEEKSDELLTNEGTLEPGKPVTNLDNELKLETEGDNSNLAPASATVESNETGQVLESNNSDYTWLLITGVFLIVAGSLSLIIRRRTS